MANQVLETHRPSAEAGRPIVVLLIDDQALVGAAVGRLLATEQDRRTSRVKDIHPTRIQGPLIPRVVDRGAGHTHARNVGRNYNLGACAASLS
jgi:hypothetical protein